MELIITKVGLWRYTVAPNKETKINWKTYKKGQPIPRKILEIGCTIYKRGRGIYRIREFELEITKNTLIVEKYNSRGKLLYKKEFDLKKEGPIIFV